MTRQVRRRISRRKVTNAVAGTTIVLGGVFVGGALTLVVVLVAIINRGFGR